MKVLSVRSTDKEGSIRDGVSIHIVKEQPGYQQKPALCGVRPLKNTIGWFEVAPDNFITCNSCKKSIAAIERKTQQELVKKFETQLQENVSPEKI